MVRFLGVRVTELECMNDGGYNLLEEKNRVKDFEMREVIILES